MKADQIVQMIINSINANAGGIKCYVENSLEDEIKWLKDHGYNLSVIKKPKKKCIKLMYIEPIIDPKILKLGIGWALYGKKKPDIFTKNTSYLKAKSIYHDELSEHLNSRIAYLKEPEFKVGDTVYCEGKEWELTEIHDKGYSLDGKMYFTIAQFRNFSHYCPGQEYDGEIKYVRECNHENEILEEPEKTVHVYGVITAKSEELTEVPNPKYTQFQEDKNKAKILAERK